MLNRLSKDQYFLLLTSLVSMRSTCKRRRVGCVLVDKNGYVLSTGYNGNPPGCEHCIDIPCPGYNEESGSNLSKCEAIHAEQNALLRCPDMYKIHTVYCTVSPCMHCIKLLMGTSAERIVFIEEYPAEQAKRLWIMSKGQKSWCVLNESKDLILRLKFMIEDTFDISHIKMFN